MAFHKIFHTLLAPLAASSAALLASGCETDATGIKITAGDRVGVLTCLFDPGEDVVVDVRGSASYSDSALHTSFGEVTVALTVNSDVTHYRRISGGSTAVSFGRLGLREGDRVWIEASIPEIDATLDGFVTVLGKREIERITTQMPQRGSTLRISTFLRDEPRTADFYQLEVRGRTYVGGVAADTIVGCEYVSPAFGDVGSSPASTVRPMGLFDDTRLDGNAEGLQFVTLNAPWEALAAHPADVTDSAMLVVRLYRHTEDYFTFLKTAAQASQYTFLPVFNTASAHTNVVGGYGIVGSIVCDEVELKLDTENRTVAPYGRD